MDILFASGNLHKKEELESLLKPHVLHLPSEFGINFECEETGLTFEENAKQKAEALWAQAVRAGLDMPIIADDSGVLVDALPGELGVHTARFGREEAGRDLSALEKNELLLKRMAGAENRSARFECVLVLSYKGNTLCAKGVAEGRILESIHEGNGGFGYDPVFYSNEAGCCFAEAGTAEKNKYSHRAKAASGMLRLMNEVF